MNLLLDTHVLIWWMEKSRRLGARAKKILLSHTARPAQAQSEDLVLMTADPAVAAYDVRTIDAGL